MQDNLNQLERIIEYKRAELPLRMAKRPVADLEKSPFFARSCLSLLEILRQGTRSGIIAEFKRKSPSKGMINENADLTAVVTQYARYGAAAVSVLTDEVFFGGSAADLIAARQAVDIPLLRKDFIIDEYQILEAKALGADLILLIAACLTPAETSRLAGFAQTLGLEVLLELHDETELGHICPATKLIGINNRDLRTFQVDTDRSLAMAAQLPLDKIKIAESGIDSPALVRYFRARGFNGFLIGEAFMKTGDPGGAFRDFVTAL